MSSILYLYLDFIFQALAAAFVATAFAMLFAVPRKYLSYIALGGFITKFIRTILFVDFGVEIAVATFFACAVSSLLFIYFAPKLKAPRPIFTTAVIIPLIPGLDAYIALLALYQVIDGTSYEIANNAGLIIHHLMRCFSILLSICLGIAVPPLFFYRYRHQGGKRNKIRVQILSVLKRV